MKRVYKYQREEFAEFENELEKILKAFLKSRSFLRQVLDQWPDLSETNDDNLNEYFNTFEKFNNREITIVKMALEYARYEYEITSGNKRFIIDGYQYPFVKFASIVDEVNEVVYKYHWRGFSGVTKSDADYVHDLFAELIPVIKLVENALENKSIKISKAWKI
jgi:hypothetical protein